MQSCINQFTTLPAVVRTSLAPRTSLPTLRTVVAAATPLIASVKFGNQSTITNIHTSHSVILLSFNASPPSGASPIRWTPAPGRHIQMATTIGFRSMTTTSLLCVAYDMQTISLVATPSIPTSRLATRLVVLMGYAHASHTALPMLLIAEEPQ